MHKKAKELMEKCLLEICGKENPSPQAFADFDHLMCGCAAFVAAEKDCSIIDAMKKSEKENEAMELMKKVQPERYGMPYWDQDEHERRYVRNPNQYEDDMRRWPMGYTGNTGNMSGSMSGSTRRSTRGSNYDSYQDAKRNYTETKSPDDKKRLDEQAKKTVSEAWDTIREAYRDGDQTLRQTMRSEAMNFVNNEMK